MELPKCNADMFQVFLNHLSAMDQQEFKILILDNGAFHHARSLVIPDNIALVFLPPYSPELNPAEKVWWLIKRELKMKLFKTIEELQQAMSKAIKKLINNDSIKQLTAFHYYQNVV